MSNDHDWLESLDPEPGGGGDWPNTDAGLRARARIDARLEHTTGLEETTVSLRTQRIRRVGAAAVVALLVIGLPLLLLRGSDREGTPLGPGVTDIPTTTTTTTTANSASPETEYLYVGTALDKAGVGPQLCMFLRRSLPPQCQGVPVVGLDWADVPWAETASDTTWAEVRLVGTFDGEQFTLTESPTAATDGDPRPTSSPDFASPCPAPPGGWVISDPERATEEAFDAARAYAIAQPEYAGLWIDRLDDEPPETDDFDAAAFILNVRFTEAVADHETALREIYGGPFCVTLSQRSAAELDAIIAELHSVLASPEAEEAGIYAGMGAAYHTDVTRGIVVAQVFAVIGDGQQWLDARYGPGVVKLYSLLIPVESSEAGLSRRR